MSVTFICWAIVGAGALYCCAMVLLHVMRKQAEALPIEQVVYE